MEPLRYLQKAERVGYYEQGKYLRVYVGGIFIIMMDRGNLPVLQY